jgi:hypothetical protein
MKHHLIHLAISLWQLLEHLPILVSSTYHKLMPHLEGYVACAIGLIGDQPTVCQHRTPCVSSYRIRVWLCNAFLFKPMRRVGLGLIASANVIIPSVTSCYSQDHSLRVASAVVALVTGCNKPEIHRDHILTIDCCLLKRYPASIMDNQCG